MPNHETTKPPAGGMIRIRVTDERAVERMVMESSAIIDSIVPERILVAPWGHVKTSAGSFIVDEASAQATIDAFAAHGTDVPVDYEHQSLGGAYSSPTGQAPAAGWIKALSVVGPAEAAAQGIEPGVWAQVEWTLDAREKLATRSYRYVSPVALVRRTDRRLVGLHSVALTNKPAIVGMKPVIGSAVRPALLPDPGDDALPDARLRAMLHLDESATEDIVLVAAAERLAALEHASAQRDAEDRVADAAGAGKLAASQRDWAMSLALRDPGEFERWRAAAPVVVPLGRLAPPDARDPDGSVSGRSAEIAARSEYRSNRAFLEKLCSEDAYVKAALR